MKLYRVRHSPNITEPPKAFYFRTLQEARIFQGENGDSDYIKRFQMSRRAAENLLLSTWESEEQEK